MARLSDLELERLREGAAGVPVDHSVTESVEALEQAVLPLATEMLAQVRVATASRSEWRDRLRAAAYAVVRFLQENPSAGRLLFVDLLAAGEHGVLLRDQGMQAAIELVDEGRVYLEGSRAEGRVTRATAEGIAGGVYRTVARAIEDGDFRKLDALVPQMMYLVLTPYLGSDAAMEELRPPLAGSE